MSSLNFFPNPSVEDLQSAFKGKSLHDVPLPSAILDLAKLRHNCKLMLDAVTELKLGFRAHVKTHKTTQLTRLQVGEDSKDVRLIVSTVVEAESLVPLMKEYQSKGAKVNILYGIPLGPSKVPRLAEIAKQLGPGSITAMIDNPAQLNSTLQFKQLTGSPMRIFIKADSGYHRAGLPPSSKTMIQLVKAVDQAESQGDVHLLGFYSHNSLSYGGNSPDDAMAMLKFEIDTCREAATHLSSNRTRNTPLVISVGASPTVLSIQNVQPSNSTSESTATATSLLSALIKDNTISSHTFAIEVHAGVYPVFDLQQIAASSRTFPSALAAHKTQALTILTEVVSVYPDRTETPEALVTTGTLALAREPCKSYPGWGVVTSWNLEPGMYSEDECVDAEKRIIVKRVSQEHGIVGWENEERTEGLPLQYGERLRIWINHACITSAAYGWYLIVDSEGKGKGEVVEDVWIRWRGW